MARNNEVNNVWFSLWSKRNMFVFFCIFNFLFESSISTSSYPIVWENTNIPVTIGHSHVELIIKLVNDCELLSTDKVHADLIAHAKAQCQKLYKDNFLDPLQDLCPQGSFQEITHGMSKRELISFLLFTIVACIIAAPAIGIAGVVIASKNQGSIAQVASIVDEHEQYLDEISDRLDAVENKFETLIEKLGKDYYYLKTTIISTIYTISSLITKFALAKQVIQQTKLSWQEGKLYPGFLAFFNYTLPCESAESSCPIQYAKPNRCRMSFDKTKVYLSFMVPVVNNTLKVVEANPFQFVHRTKNESCTLKYSGPKYVIRSTVDHCVYSTNVEKRDIVLAPSIACSLRPSQQETSKHFVLDHCVKRYPNDIEDSVQMKVLQDNILVYCPDNNYTIGTNTRPCPDMPMIFPTTSSFNVGSRRHQGFQYSLTFQQKQDDLFTMDTNEYFESKYDLEQAIHELNKTKPRLHKNHHDELENLKDNASGFEHVILYTVIAALGLGILILLVWLFIIKKTTSKVQSSTFNKVDSFVEFQNMD